MRKPNATKVYETKIASEQEQHATDEKHVLEVELSVGEDEFVEDTAHEDSDGEEADVGSASPRQLSLLAGVHEAVNMGGLRLGTKSVKVVRQGAEELTLRAEEVGSRRTFIDTTHVEAERWGPPQVDADWHACQAIYPGIEGHEQETMFYYYKYLHQAVRTKTLGWNQKARAPWAMKAAKDEHNYDPTHQSIGFVGRSPKNLVAALRWNVWAPPMNV